MIVDSKDDANFEIFIGARDPRGFSVKFRTEEGNWDMVANNTPVFFLRDPAKFPHFIHTQKRHPASHLTGADEYVSLCPWWFVLR